VRALEDRTKLASIDPSCYTPIVKKIKAAFYLLDKYSEEGTLLKPNEYVDPDYAQDVDFDVDMEQS